MNGLERNHHNSHLPSIKPKELQRALYGRVVINVRKFPSGWSGGNIDQLINSARRIVENPGGGGHPKHELAKKILDCREVLVERFGRSG